jgi:hypothetical protein
VSGIEIVVATSPSNSNDKSSTATCPANKTIVGGGGKTSSSSVWVIGSAPGTVGANNKATTWVADAQEEGNGIGSSWTVTAYAICATG